MTGMRMPVLILILFPLAVIADEGVSWSIDAELGYGYDSNVVVDDVDLATSEGDRFVNLGVGAGVKLETANDYSFSANIDVSDKQFESFDEFDGRLVLGSVNLSRDLGDVTLGLDLRYVDYQLDGAGFIELRQVSPSVSWFPSKRSFLRLAYEYTEEEFDDAPDRSNDQDRFSMLGYFFINGLKEFVTLRLQYADDTAVDELQDNQTKEVRITYHRDIQLFRHDASVEVGYRYQQRGFDERVHPSVGGYRKDRRQRYELSLEVPLSDSVSIETEISVNDYQSNLESADYSQNVVQLSLKYAL
jgi:hypothetical protein